MIKIRKPKSLEELNTIADFQVKMCQETEGYLLDQATVVKGAKHIFENEILGHYLIAIDEENNQIVGSLLVQKEWSDWRCKTVLWIHSVYVIKEYRKKGIFKKMYLYLKNQVIESTDLAGIRLYVEKSNTSAQKVYQKLSMTNEHYDLYEYLK